MSKDLYESFLRVLEVFDNDNNLSKEDAIAMFGEERFAQMRNFVNTYKGSGIVSGNWGFTKGAQDDRRAFKLYCREMISKIDKEEYERDLRIKEIQSNIDYNNVTRRISISSAVIAFLALVASIAVPILLNKNDCHCPPVVQAVHHTDTPDTSIVASPHGLRDSMASQQPSVKSSLQSDGAKSAKSGASR